MQRELEQGTQPSKYTVVQMMLNLHNHYGIDDPEELKPKVEASKDKKKKKKKKGKHDDDNDEEGKVGKS